MTRNLDVVAVRQHSEELQGRVCFAQVLNDGHHFFHALQAVWLQLHRRHNKISAQQCRCHYVAEEWRRVDQANIEILRKRLNMGAQQRCSIFQVKLFNVGQAIIIVNQGDTRVIAVGKK
ncbi:hypothetical protein D3C78_1596630 [compost metagenome]